MAKGGSSPGRLCRHWNLRQFRSIGVGHAFDEYTLDRSSSLGDPGQRFRSVARNGGARSGSAVVRSALVGDRVARDRQVGAGPRCCGAVLPEADVRLEAAGCAQKGGDRRSIASGVPAFPDAAVRGYRTRAYREPHVFLGRSVPVRSCDRRSRSGISRVRKFSS